VTDAGQDAVLRVDPITGDRTVISSPLIGNGINLEFPLGIDVEADGNLVVTDISLDAILRVDPTTGDRTVVADATTGSGPVLSFFRSITVDTDGGLIVTDGTLHGVFRVDPTTGDRTVISDATTGNGPMFVLPRGIVVDTDGNYVVVDIVLGVVVFVNRATGDRRIAGIIFPATRYVATTGNDDSNDCSNPGSPYATLAHAGNQATDGDIIDLATGTYNEPGLVIEKNLFIRGQGVVVQ